MSFEFLIWALVIVLEAVTFYLFGYAKGRRDEAAGKEDRWL